MPGQLVPNLSMHSRYDDPERNLASLPVLPARGIGFYILGVVLLGCAANALNQADRGIMPIAVIPMSQEFKWNMFERGLVLSSFFLGYLFVQIPSGVVSTRFAPLPVLGTAVFLWSLGTALTPFAAYMGLHVLLTCRVAVGLAEGFCLPAVFQLFTTDVPSSIRSSAFAAMCSAGCFGNCVALVTCPQIVSWSSMFTRFGLAGFGWYIAFAFLWLRTSAGRTAICSNGSKTETFRLRDGCCEAEKHVLDADPTLLHDTQLWRRLISSGPVLAICAAHFGQNWTAYTLAIWLPTYLNEVLGMSTNGLWVIALPPCIASLTGTLSGFLADLAVSRQLCSILTVRKAATVMGLVGQAGCCALFAYVRSPFFAVVVISLGAAFGSFTGCGYMANHSDISTRYAGLTFSIANTLATVPGIVAGPFAAWIAHYFPDGHWKIVFMLAASINCVCAAVYAASARAHRVL